jgi:hypothetical protein
VGNGTGAGSDPGICSGNVAVVAILNQSPCVARRGFFALAILKQNERESKKGRLGISAGTSIP